MLAQQKSTIVQLVKNFLKANPKTGYVIFHVFQESPTAGKLPIPNARVAVSKYLGEGYFVSTIHMTDANGDTDMIPLPTVQTEPSSTPEQCNECPTYNARIEAPGFITKDILGFKVLQNTSSHEQVELLPGANEEVRQIFIEENHPRL